MAGYGTAENLADAQALALMLRTLYGLRKPTVACVHGAAFGGGVGLVACCDIAVAAQDATFSLSEAKLGLIPATISPVRHRGDRRAPGAALLPHRGTVHCRGGVPDRPRPRHRAGGGTRHADQRTAGRVAGRGTRGATGMQGADPRRRAPSHRRRRHQRTRPNTSPRFARRPKARKAWRRSWASGRPAWVPDGTASEEVDQCRASTISTRCNWWRSPPRSGWASGLRLYAVLFIVGAVGYLGWVDLPAGLRVLAHPFVLAASGFMCFVEFFADKIPGVDSLWDIVHTFIRVPAGAALAAGVFGDSSAARDACRRDRRRYAGGGQPSRQGGQPRSHQHVARAVLELDGVVRRRPRGRDAAVARVRASGRGARRPGASWSR